jgi:hypothetical protein
MFSVEHKRFSNSKFYLIKKNNTGSIRRACQCTWRDYEVPGVILLSNLKGAMKRDPSEDVSVHVSTCTSYDFNALTPVVWKL